MKNALSLYQSDIVLKKEFRSYQNLRAMANDILEHQQQDPLISKKRPFKGESSNSIFF